MNDDQLKEALRYLIESGRLVLELKQTVAFINIYEDRGVRATATLKFDGKEVISKSDSQSL